VPELVTIRENIAGQSGRADEPHGRMIGSLTDSGAENGPSWQRVTASYFPAEMKGGGPERHSAQEEARSAT